MEETITIPKNEYLELKNKAEAYDKNHELRARATSKAGKASANSLTPEQRRERAKKAVEARIKKYGQKTKTDSQS